MKHWSARRHAAGLIVLTGLGCASVTEFDPGRLAETTEARCADGIDNDRNGLLDCQEFGCLATQKCCVLPRVHLADDFRSGLCLAAGCDAGTGAGGSGDGGSPDGGTPGGAPDDDGGTNSTCINEGRWQAWGSPYPMVCGDALVVTKRENCYPVGVRGRQPVRLGSDLHVTVGMDGQLTNAARRIIGLALVDDIQGSRDHCAAVAPVELIFGLTAEAAAGGYRFVAQYDAEPVGTSPVVSDERRHEAALQIAADGRVRYLLDGQEFAASPADLPVPDGVNAYLVLAGVGRGARFTDAQVTSAVQCDTPAAWVPAARFVTLETPPYSANWDGFQLGSPAVLESATGAIDLYYVGCGNGTTSVECEPSDWLRVGLARSLAGGAFSRTPEVGGHPEPVSITDLPSTAGGALDVGVVQIGAEPWLLLSTGGGILLYRPTNDGAGFEPVTGVPPVPLGPAGAWDDATICCASALRGPDGRLRLWYAAQSSMDAYPTWRVGLATSVDGLLFEKSDRNPVLQEGTLEEFDGRGATEPEVVYDESRALYRMWYGARAFLGGTGIGYAVSADGAVWHKFPGNPVVTPEALGLELVASPAALVGLGDVRLWLQGRAPGTQGTTIYEVTNAGVDYVPPEE